MGIVLVFSSAVACFAEQNSANTDHPDGGSISLDGPWQFHLGDNLNWAQADTPDTAGTNGWEQIRPDQTWGTQGHWAYTGFAWYRKHIHYVPTPGASPDVALLMRHVDDAYELYWNGTLIGHLGSFPPNGVYYRFDPAHTFGLGPVRDGVLAVRVWKAPMFSEESGDLGGFHLAPVIGSPKSIAALKADRDYAWMRGNQYIFGLDSLYGLVLLLSFLGWLRNRSQHVLFWMSVLSGGNVLEIFLDGLRFPWSYKFLLGWLQPILALQHIGLCFLLLYLLKLDGRVRLKPITCWLTTITFIANSLDGLLLLFDWSNPSLTRPLQVSDAVLKVIVSALNLYPLALVVLGLRRRLDSARWAVAIAAFLDQMVFVIPDILVQGSRYTHWSFGFTMLNTPLFTIAGNVFFLSTIAHTLLFLTLIYAVYSATLEARRRQNALELEIRGARELQQVLIPEMLPEISGYAMTSVYRPATEVGGDFFQILQAEGKDAGSTLILLGDVSGKGLKAAMTVSLIVGTVRTLAGTTSSPAEVLSGLNHRLHGRLQGRFATCLAPRLDGDGGCVLASAGHPAPYQNGKEVGLPGALPLGLNASTIYEETSLKLNIGDHLVLYTDGLLEARSADGEIFSFDRLKELFASNPNAEKAVEAAVDFGQDDDITVLTLTRLAVGEQSTTQLSAPLLTTGLA